MITRHVILTERTKNKRCIDYNGKNFYSAVYGCNSKLKYASVYFNFEDAQSVIKRLRKIFNKLDNKIYVYAIEIPISVIYRLHK